MGKSTSVRSSVSREEDYLKTYDAASHLSSGFMADDSSVDANSEKELVWIVIMAEYCSVSRLYFIMFHCLFLNLQF